MDVAQEATQAGKSEERSRRGQGPGEQAASKDRFETVSGAKLTPIAHPARTGKQLDDERPQQRQEADGASAARSRGETPVTDPPTLPHRPSASSRTPLRLSTSSPTRTRSRFSSTRSSTLARVRTRPGSDRRVPSAVRPSTSRPSAASTRPSPSSPSVFASRRSATSSRSPSAVSPPSACSPPARPPACLVTHPF